MSSIKSQKSLEEECADIIEKGYLVKTPSDESLSGSDPAAALSSELVRKLLSPPLLSRMKTMFRAGPGGTVNSRIDQVMTQAAAQEGVEFPQHTVRGRPGLWICREGFVKAVHEVFDGPKYTPHAEHLFHTLDPLHTGRVGWEQLLDRVIEEGGRRTRSKAEVWTPVKVVEMKKMEHCKRETIVKLVPIEQSDSFCYCVISRGGRVIVTDGNMMTLNSYEMFYHRTGLKRRVKNCWITDAVYLSDVQYLVLSSSDRSLSLYDVSTLSHSLVYCITGLPDIPTCISYAPSPRPATPRLCIGTQCGDVINITFLLHTAGLFCGGDGESVKCYYWMELARPPHTSYVSISTWRRVHSRSVRRLCLTRNGDILLSCSHDSVASLRVRYVNGKMDDYVFKVQRGVTCFTHSSTLHVYVTGSADCVRVWGRAGGADRRLTAPALTRVIDVAVQDQQGVVLAYCVDCHLYLWDIFEECLLQTVRVRFPFLDTLGKKIEFGNYCMFAGPPHLPLPTDPHTDDDNDDDHEENNLRASRYSPHLLVTCCDYICRISLSIKEVGPVVPPPRDVRTTRRPSAWDVTDEDFIPSSSSRDIKSSLLESTADTDVVGSEDEDVDSLLQKAGLENILEKDFVLMMGLKSDLHKKLGDMKRSMANWSLLPAAPHRHVMLFEPDDITPAVNDVTSQHYQKVISMFPPPSQASTPSTSARTRSERDANTRRTPSERDANTQRTPSERDENTRRTPSERDANTRRTPSERDANTRRTPNERDANTRRTPSERDANTRRTPS